MLFLRERQERVDVLGGNWCIADLRLQRGAGIAGGDDHFLDIFRPGQLPGQCMLATATADDEDFHG